MLPINRLIATTVFGLFFSSFITGCGETEEPYYDCDMSAHPSLIVTVKDTHGMVVEDEGLVVQFQQGDGTQWKHCTQSSDTGPLGSGRPTFWYCSRERTGLFKIRATLGERTAQMDDIEVIMADHCHVKTREVEIVLQ